MPGRYSHGLVFAQYSAQGIISLPNDDYLRSSTHPRAASAAAFRQRTPSITTQSTGFHSINSRSAKSVGGVPQPRSNSLRGNGTTTTPGRVVIVSTDSESEVDSEESDESEEEWVRPQVTATGARGNAVKGYQRAKLSNDNQSRIDRPGDQRADTWRRRPIPNVKAEKDEAEKKQLPHIAPTKRGGGVRALMQARYEAEMKKAVDEASDGDDEGTGISLREILKAPAGPREKTLTMQEFLNNVSNPSTHEKDGVDEKATLDKANPTPKPIEEPYLKPEQEAKAVAGSAYQRQASRNHYHISNLAKSQSTEVLEAEPSFEGFSDSEEQSDFPFPTIATSNRRQQNSSSDNQTFRRMTNPRLAPSPTVVAHNQPAQDAMTSESAMTPALKSARRLKIRKAKSVGNHTRAESSLASLESDMSSIFGMSSVGGTTQATSGYSPASRSVSKLQDRKTWDLPQIPYAGSMDNFGDMFHDINHTITIFTSDEEAEEEHQHDEEQDLPTPRLQRIPESELFPAGQWGMISSGQNTSNQARDEDEMSDVSAVFPPDIGRYKHDGYGRSPLATALSAQSEPMPKPERSRVFKKKLQKQKKDTGLLQKLRSKASR